MINYLKFQWSSNSTAILELSRKLNEDRISSLCRKPRGSLVEAVNSIITTINVLLSNNNTLIAVPINRNLYYGKSRRNPAHTSEVYIALLWLIDNDYLKKVQGRKAIFDGKKATGKTTPFVYEVHPRLIIDDIDMNPIKRNPLLDYIDVRVKYKGKNTSVGIMETEKSEFQGLITSTSELLKDYDDLMSKTELSIGTQKVNTFQTSLTRIFSQGTLYKGGRFYCPLQNLKSLARPYIRFNDEPTVEIDYSSLHPTMLYNLAEEAMPDEDAYTITGFKRSVVKVAFNIMLNRDGGSNKSSSAKSLAYNTGIEFKDAKKLERAIIDKHKPITQYFNSGVGLDLQRIDSDIMMCILDYFVRKLKRPILPIHDSAVVLVRDVESLRLAMESAYQEVIPRDNEGLPRILKAIKVESLPFTEDLNKLIEQSLDGSLINYDKDYWDGLIKDNKAIQCPEEYLSTDITIEDIQ